MSSPFSLSSSARPESKTVRDAGRPDRRGAGRRRPGSISTTA